MPKISRKREKTEKIFYNKVFVDTKISIKYLIFFLQKIFIFAFKKKKTNFYSLFRPFLMATFSCLCKFALLHGLLNLPKVNFIVIIIVVNCFLFTLFIYSSNTNQKIITYLLGKLFSLFIINNKHFLLLVNIANN